MPRYRDRTAPEDVAMTEDKTKTTPQDARPITLTENYEIAYGTKRFGSARIVARRLCAASGTRAQPSRRSSRRRRATHGDRQDAPVHICDLCGDGRG